MCKTHVLSLRTSDRRHWCGNPFFLFIEKAIIVRKTAELLFLNKKKHRCHPERSERSERSRRIPQHTTYRGILRCAQDDSARRENGGRPQRSELRRRTGAVRLRRTTSKTDVFPPGRRGVAPTRKGRADRTVCGRFVNRPYTARPTRSDTVGEGLAPPGGSRVRPPPATGAAATGGRPQESELRRGTGAVRDGGPGQPHGAAENSHFFP